MEYSGLSWLQPPRGLERRFLVSWTASRASSASHRQTLCRNPDRRHTCLLVKPQNGALPACWSGGRSCVCASIRIKRRRLSLLLRILRSKRKRLEGVAHSKTSARPSFVLPTGVIRACTSVTYLVGLNPYSFHWFLEKNPFGFCGSRQYFVCKERAGEDSLLKEF